jgi:hypothetical protein
MHYLRSSVPLLILGCVLAQQAPAEETRQSADQIMEKVDHAVRKAFTTQLSSVKITTCKYTIRNGKVSCTDKPRVVVASNAKKNAILDGSYNAQSLAVVEEPLSDKGLGLLVYEYGERGRDNDNWLYLPALGKINRVIANDDEAGSVFGSEFSVENTQNPEARKLYEYTYQILEEATYQERPAWVIEMTPKPEKARKTSYAKVVAWIDKQTYIALKEDLYRNGRIHKQRTQTNIKPIDDVYVATKVVMNNLETQRLSQMDKMSMAHDKEIPDDFLTQRALTDFAFRERNLARFRTFLK